VLVLGASPDSLPFPFLEMGSLTAARFNCNGLSRHDLSIFTLLAASTASARMPDHLHIIYSSGESIEF
jgi:hypothetical protein